jgi:hypothetical protein
MRESGNTISKMVMDQRNSPMELSIRESIRMARGTAEVILNLRINLTIEVTLLMGRFMVLEFLDGLMVVNLRETGKTINSLTGL